MVYKRDPKLDIHSYILKKFEAGYWPDNEIPLSHWQVIHQKTDYLVALESGDKLPWIIPHRFFQTFPTALPYFELDVRPDEQEVFLYYYEEDDLEKRLRSELRNAREKEQELGLVSADFSILDHLEFVRDAVRKTGPTNPAAQARIEKRAKETEFRNDGLVAINKTNLNSPFYVFQALYHFTSIRRQRRKRAEKKPLDIPSSRIKILNRLSPMQQMLLALVLIALWVWLVSQAVDWLLETFG